MFFLDYIKSYFLFNLPQVVFAHPEVEEIIDGGYKAITFLLKR